MKQVNVHSPMLIRNIRKLTATAPKKQHTSSFSMDEIVFFFRKTVPGAHSINQIFESLAGEIGKTHEVRIHKLNNAGASPLTITANISEASSTAGKGINHITGDVHYISLGIWKGRTVLTIHDCVTLDRIPRWHPKFHIIKWLWFKLPVMKADMVTTISEKSKSEIIRHTGCLPDKIKVISNFVGHDFRFDPKSFNRECPRILQVGTKPNKNLERVAKALEGIPCLLEIIGRLNLQQLECLRRYKIKYEQNDSLSQEGVVDAYRRSDMVVFASTYEGFGMPVIEAQATGRPVVTSNIQPMVSVAGGSACLVNPLNTFSIRDGILSVIDNEDYRHMLIMKGVENIKRFTVRQVADSYIELYRELMNNN